jgi:hypothetical protein
MLRIEASRRQNISVRDWATVTIAKDRHQLRSRRSGGDDNDTLYDLLELRKDRS